VLERLYNRYNHRSFIKTDPMRFLYWYSNQADMEIVAFLAAALAYGRVRQIQKSLMVLLERIGDSPAAFVCGFDKPGRKKLKDFKHRFTTGDDISDLLTLLKNVLSEHGSIERFFLQGYNYNDENIIPALSKFCDSLLDMYAETHNGHITRGLRYLLPRPAAGSTCKRLNLFLRWMVRNDRVDAGLWKGIDKAKLIVPVDVHMARLCRILELYDQKTASLSAALEITERFAEMEPADPVKYDFALSRVGILKNCTGRLRNGCSFCELFESCFRAERR